MPYTPAQCRLFGAKQGRGEAVPEDWKEHCKKDRGRLDARQRKASSLRKKMH